jgi:hypothetical protein
MEILLIACMLAWAAGAQSEQAKLGLSPAQRATMKERARHEKAIRNIAEKYGADEGGKTNTTVSSWKDAPAAAPTVSLPAAFQSGYRRHTPIERIATPLGRRAGYWTAQGVAWAKDTGRGAVREYRRHRKAAGQEDPAPVLVPMPPTHPPTVGTGVAEPSPAPPAGQPAVPAARTPGEQPAGGDSTAPTTDSEPAPAGEGVGRMAAEVTYESVSEESDELSLMCDDDIHVYGRIRQRCEREIGRADELIAALENAGAGQGVVGRVASCKEQYQVLLGQLDDLQTNTVAQGEAVVKAKALLEAGQGVYADIAQDMESVAKRDFYTSDAVDGEDTAADNEIYETKDAA